MKPIHLIITACVFLVLWLCIDKCPTKPPTPAFSDIKHRIIIFIDGILLIEDEKKAKESFSKIWDTHIDKVLKKNNDGKSIEYPNFELKVLALSDISGQGDKIFEKEFSKADAKIMEEKNNGAERIKETSIDLFQKGVRKFKSTFNNSDSNPGRDKTIKIISTSQILSNIFEEACTSKDSLTIIYLSDMIELDYGGETGEYYFKEHAFDEFSSYGINSALQHIEDPNSYLFKYIEKTKPNPDCLSKKYTISILKPNHFKLKMKDGIDETDINKFWKTFFNKLGYSVTFTSS